MKTMAYVANSESGGIGAYELDRAGGRLIERGRFLEKSGMSPLAVSLNRRFLYAGVRGGDPAVAAFAVDTASGELHLLNSVPVSASVTYMTVDATGRFLLCASYGGDFVWVLPLGRDGMVQPEPSCGLRPGRNPHCVLLDASNRFVYIPTLGSDFVAQYAFDERRGILTPLDPPHVSTPRESGPRHAVASPDNRFVFLLTELSGEVVRYAINQDTGALIPQHGVPLLPEDRALPPSRYEPPRNQSAGPNSPSPVIWAADIRITPDGRFLYASERTNSTLSCFRVDPVSGRLDPAGIVETEERPRGFAVDPMGAWLAVAGEMSNFVSLYAVDRDGGGLTRTERIGVGSGPNWIEFIVL